MDGTEHTLDAANFLSQNIFSSLSCNKMSVIHQLQLFNIEHYWGLLTYDFCYSQ